MQTQRPLSQELSLRAILLGTLLAIVMGSANVYLGLKVGMTVSASIPSAVLAMLILRGVFRTGTIWEANQVQNAASAGESLAAGIIFTMPAMILIGAWTRFDLLTTTLVAFAGGMLGVLFMIPMRRVFITGEHKNDLPFPEAVACAAVLKSGSKETGSSSDALRVVYGGIFGALIKLGTNFFGVIRGTIEGASLVGGRIFYFGGDVSAALVGVGFIIGLNVAALVLLGGLISWLIAIPLLGVTEGGLGDLSALDTAYMLYKTQVRFLGVGAMAVGGVVSIYKVRGGLLQAVKELAKTFKKNGADASTEPERDIPIGIISLMALICTTLIAGLYYHLTGNITVTVITLIVMLVMGFFFTAVASYIAGLVGMSNSPISGMTISTVLVTAALLYILGYAGMEGMVATIGVAAIVCCVASTAGDMANELKIGHLVGSSPNRQQLMQMLGVAASAAVMGPIMQLLQDNTPGGLGGRELPAPQASMFASLVQGFFGDGQIPWNMVAIGVGIALVVLLLDGALARRQAKFRLHLMPLAVGLYLPVGLGIPMLIGACFAHALGRGAKNEHELETRLNRGVLFSSGAVAGEALMGVGLAGLISAGIASYDLGLSSDAVAVISYAAVAVMLVMFYIAAKPQKS